MVKHLLAVLVVAWSAAWAVGQPLADRVPSDAILYIGWQGSEAMPPAYANSHLKGVIDASSFGALFADFLPQLVQSVSKGDPQATQTVQLVKSFGLPLWQHSSALFLAGVDFKAANGPRAKAAVICRAGDQADALLNQIKPLVELTKDTPAPLRAFKSGDIVVLAAGYDNDGDVLAGDATKAIATSAKFQQVLAQVKGDSVACGYVDAEAAMSLVDQAVATFAPPDDAGQWKKVRDALGLGGLQRIIIAGGFDGPDWSTRMFIGTNGPRQGLLTLLESKAISDEALKLIPQSAMAASVERFDLGGLFDLARTIAGQIDPQAQQAFDAGVAVANQTLGFDLRNDLLGAFGNEWVLISGGGGNALDPVGMVLVNRLAKPADAERSLNQLEQLAKRLGAGPMQQAGVTLVQNKVGAATVHTINMPQASPSWTIRDGQLYISLFSQTMTRTLQTPAEEKGIGENADFAALRKKLAAGNAISFSFADLRKTAPVLYPEILKFTQLGFGAAQMAGVKPPANVLPEQQRLTEHLGAAAGFTWIDDAGWHYNGISPFPGSTILSPNGNMTTVAGSAALGVAILLPALNSAKERANRVKCASNMRQIGQGVMLYANDHKGAYPTDMSVLVKEVDLNPEVFVCPSASGSVPAAIRNAPVAEKMKWVNEHTDYIYLGAKMNSGMPADLILVYEKLDDHERQGINIMFNDGHIEWVLRDAAMQMIRKQQPGAVRADPIRPEGFARTPAPPPAPARITPDASGRMPAGRGVQLNMARDGKSVAAAPAEATPVEKPAPAAAAAKKTLDPAAAAQGKLSLAESYAQSGAAEKAKAIYEAVIRDYPGTPAAAEATKRLAQIK